MQNIGLYYWNVAVWEKRWGQFSVCGCVCVQKELKRRIAKRHVSSELQSKRREKETNIKKNIINTHTELAWRLYLRSAVLWFLNWSDWAAGEGGGLGRKGRWKREKERDEGRHLQSCRVVRTPYNYLHPLCQPQPARTDRYSREKLRARHPDAHSHIKE